MAAMALAGIVLAGPARAVEAGASDWVRNDQGGVRLISAVSAVGDASDLQMGLEFHLKPGWKIYWRSPGDAGFPPSIDWKGSDNLAEAVMSWPAPHRFSVSGMETMGYKDNVVLPLVIRLNDAGQAVSLRASVDYLTCDVLCVPQHADLALDLPASPTEATAHAHLISRFLAQVPSNGALQGLTLVSSRATETGSLKVVVTADPPMSNPDLFIERADQLQFAKPKVRLQMGGRRVVFEATPVPNTGEGDLFDKPLTLTVVDGARGMEVVADVAQAEPGSRFSKTFAMLGIALLGGFILNLMPCVLPVLSIKVLGLIGHAGAARATIRTGFLASAAGIVASFLILAVAAVSVRAAGSAVGWGIQFQQPLFLVAMVVVITLFSANLFGFFEIGLPRWAGAVGGSGNRQGLVGHFASGAFATLLATPCSAPFLGTAVGFALARGAPEIFAIFIALGLGMALPYLAIAAWPQLAQRLPRPGRWMIGLRFVLGAVLLATAGWLLVVLSAEAGLRAGAIIGGLMLVILAVLSARHRLSGIARVVAVVLVSLAAVVVSNTGTPRPAAGIPADLKGVWKPFDRETLARSVADGKVVFVDVTADWCITCQVNKAAVVYRGKVAQSLTAPDVVALEADWTRPDEAITAYLASFGRYGIPFNAVYGPGAPDGIALPELLTEDAVMEALAKARKPS
ncbi:protein-disulfide reductase DsbD domain-containing protein [Telmatospirillum sp.]|uniref:protein-disulfide reductase DsbD family protein n=1 Tax=Telmatospirillum sp. TaxID=2079197 RepID=UPI0028471ACC|nr:protein-disulfide reductase DsbD domain-containing protein [Telmatospirillum sp.]MDR3435942.1 protein-disulfide reductase DsbD family protein [Telmatospirillum sp.]